jgi:hypothetical protein
VFGASDFFGEARVVELRIRSGIESPHLFNLECGVWVRDFAAVKVETTLQ